MPKKLTIEEFIQKAKLKHGDKFDYSKFEYENSKVKGIIICPKHGEFPQTPNSHLRGDGCYNCGMIRISLKNSKEWTEESINKLKNLYPNTKNECLAKLLNISYSAIKSKARKLGLKKSKQFRSEWIGKKNKMVGRDLSIENLTKIALKYKSRGEFQLKDRSAYSTARKQNLLSVICKHMVSQNYSIPQLILRDIMDNLLKCKALYNNRKILYPHEIDIFYTDFNLAFEYQGKKWHENNKQDEIKKNKFNSKNINIIYIIQNSRKYEEDVKNQLINNLDKINNICKTNLTENDIKNYKINNVFLEIYNKEDLFNIAKKYTSYKEFRTKEISTYNKLLKMKLLDEATSHIKDKRKFYTNEEMKIIIDNCKDLKDLRQNHSRIYFYIKRNNKEDLISHLNSRMKRINFTIDDIKNKISQYTTRNDFVKENKKMYIFLKSKKLTYLLLPIRTNKRKYPDDYKYHQTC